MGSLNSKPVRPAVAVAPAPAPAQSDDEISYNEKHSATSYDLDDLAQYLDKVNITPGTKSDTSNPITLESLDDWQHELEGDPKNVLAQNALGANSIAAITEKTDSATKLHTQYTFNTAVDVVGSPSYWGNQKSAGTCWIYATSNVLRAHVIKKYNLAEDKFQVSQPYLYFYDKLEKANYFLDQIIDTASEPIDSRLVSFLLRDPVGDGGQWDMIINLVEKYGIVPHEFFSGSFQASASAALNSFLAQKLREYALVLRKLVDKGVPAAVIGGVKASFNKEIYRIVAIAFGSAPKPTDSFVWEFFDKDGKYHYYKTTPIEFYKNHVGYDAASHFSIINDPRNAYDKLYTVARLNNVVGGKKIEYVNTEISEVKAIAIRQLKDNEPIFFGSDVGKFSNSKSGVLDPDAWDYTLAFNTSLSVGKAERITLGSSVPSHAMVITAVHIDPITNEPVRWKIENSWGDEVGDKGFFVMSDKWFSEYVFQIVTSKKYVSKKTWDVYKSGDFNVLPYYDPLGTLA